MKYLLIIFLAFIPPAFADSTGFQFPRSSSNNPTLFTGDGSWSRVSNIEAEAGSEITDASDDVTDALYGFNYPFSSIPAGSTIDGIELQIRRQGDGPSEYEDFIVRLTRDGLVGVGENKAIGTTYTSTPATITYGGANDLWNTTWTSSQIKASAFGAYLSALETQDVGEAVSVFWFKVNVHYTPAGVKVNGVKVNGAKLGS